MSIDAQGSEPDTLRASNSQGERRRMEFRDFPGYLIVPEGGSISGGAGHYNIAIALKPFSCDDEEVHQTLTIEDIPLLASDIIGCGVTPVQTLHAFASHLGRLCSRLFSSRRDSAGEALLASPTPIAVLDTGRY